MLNKFLFCGPLKALDDNTKRIFYGKGGHSDSFIINFVSFKTFKVSLVYKQGTGIEHDSTSVTKQNMLVLVTYGI